jgi:hypothetical protein
MELSFYASIHVLSLVNLFSEGICNGTIFVGSQSGGNVATYFCSPVKEPRCDCSFFEGI